MCARVCVCDCVLCVHVCVYSERVKISFLVSVAWPPKFDGHVLSTHSSRTKKTLARELMKLTEGSIRRTEQGLWLALDTSHSLKCCPGAHPLGAILMVCKLGWTSGNHSLRRKHEASLSPQPWAVSTWRTAGAQELAVSWGNERMSRW